MPAADAGHSLGHELIRNWPQYAAYAVSFMTIGIIWVNHHVMISRLRATDHTILIGNLLVLMTIGILPFATDLIAKHLHHADGQSLAAAIYAGAFLVMGIAFGSLNRLILLRRPDLLAVQIPLARRRQILLRSMVGSAPVRPRGRAGVRVRVRDAGDLRRDRRLLRAAAGLRRRRHRRLSYQRRSGERGRVSNS